MNGLTKILNIESHACILLRVGTCWSCDDPLNVLQLYV